MLYLYGLQAVAATLILVLAVLGSIFIVVVILTLWNHFTVDRLLGIVGALGGIGWLAGVLLRVLRSWLRNTELDEYS